MGNKGKFQGNQVLKMRGTKSQFWVTGTIGNFGEQSNSFQGNNETGTPWTKCDTSSNDTLSNEPFHLKVTSSKWHFVDCAHC